MFLAWVSLGAIGRRRVYYYCVHFPATAPPTQRSSRRALAIIIECVGVAHEYYSVAGWFLPEFNLTPLPSPLTSTVWSTAQCWLSRDCSTHFPTTPTTWISSPTKPTVPFMPSATCSEVRSTSCCACVNFPIHQFPPSSSVPPLLPLNNHYVSSPTTPSCSWHSSQTHWPSYLFLSDAYHIEKWIVRASWCTYPKVCSWCVSPCLWATSIVLWVVVIFF